MFRYLIINADDFGLSHSVNRGIIEAVCSGTVTSVSMFANLPGFDDAVEKAKRFLGETVGVHFNLTYGQPVSPPDQVQSLVNAKGQFRLDDLDWSNPGWSTRDVEFELAAQYEMIRNAGLTVSHLDSHHYIHNYKNVFEVFIRLAEKHDLPIRQTRKRRPETVGRTTDHLVTGEYFSESGISLLVKAINNLNPGITELNCHPGYRDQVLESISSWSVERETELACITSEQVKRALRNNGIKLIGFMQLPELLEQRQSQ